MVLEFGMHSRNPMNRVFLSPNIPVDFFPPRFYISTLYTIGHKTKDKLYSWMGKIDLLAGPTYLAIHSSQANKNTVTLNDSNFWMRQVDIMVEPVVPRRLGISLIEVSNVRFGYHVNKTRGN